MLRSAVFAIGLLAAFGGFGWAAVSALANNMADAPAESSGAGPLALIGCAGVIVMLAAAFLMSS